ncbi:MAG: AAA family ATPase [Nitrosopumilaceae archaeon]
MISGTSDSSVKKLQTSRVNNDDFSLKINFSKNKKVDSKKLHTYDIKKYVNPDNFNFPEDMQELIPKDTPPYYDKGENYVERIVRALGYFKQCACIGPSGTGKTHIVYLVAELTQLPLWEINCGLQTSAYDLFGRYIGLGKENWIDGIITSWCRYGGILYLDEANMMKQDVATKLNPILDARGHMVLNEKDNELINRHKDAYMIISMNPFSSEFTGTKPLNAAFRRRMSVWLNFDYMSVGTHIDEKEINLLLERTGITRDTATSIVHVAAKLRQEYKNGDLPYGPSVGDLANWARIIADGATPIDAGNETLVAMTSDDYEIQDEVRKIISSVDWQETNASNDPKSLIIVAIEKSLLEMGKPDLNKVKERLMADYNRTLADCYEEPEFLNRILKDIYGKAHVTIIDSIKKNLRNMISSKPVQEFLEQIAR